ncbi:glycosyltransferase family 4 protein [Fibrella sp. Tmos10]
MFTSTETKSIIVLNSHPIQYFAPLYRQIAIDQSIQLKVLYCSRHGLNGETDRQFNTSVRWDIPLLEGYNHAFISNQALNPSIYRFWGLLNLSVIRYLWQAPKSIVWVHGWAYATCWVALIAAKLFGHTVCLRGEAPYKLERTKPWLMQRLRRVVLGQGLFSFIDYFLYIGEQNRRLYTHMGVAPHKLIHMPYAVDNCRFHQQARVLAETRAALRTQMKVPPGAFVLLMSGKYVAKKRPLDLLKAVAKLKNPAIVVILMGDGPLRGDIERYVQQQAMSSVYLTGFVNQSAVSDYYAVADVYVMCSTEEETWGLSTNEAMNFGLPLILSNQVGGADDLVQDGVNGYVVPGGDVAELAKAIQKMMSQPAEARQQMGQQSLQLVRQHSYDRIIQSLQQHLLTP